MPARAQPMPGRELEVRNAGRDIQSGSASDTHRLQSECIVGAAGECISVQANADSRAAGRTDITAGKRARAPVLAGREHEPFQDRLSGNAEVDTKAPDRRDVALRMSALWAEHTLKLVNRADNEAHGAAAPALEVSNLNARLRGRRCCDPKRDQCGSESETRHQ